jgi:hypothetical protein
MATCAERHGDFSGCMYCGNSCGIAWATCHNGCR